MELYVYPMDDLINFYDEKYKKWKLTKISIIWYFLKIFMLLFFLLL